MKVNLSDIKAAAQAAHVWSETIGESNWFVAPEMVSIGNAKIDGAIGEADATHIAACDPQTILAMCAAIEAARAMADAFDPISRTDALEDLRQALQPFLAAAPSPEPAQEGKQP